VLLFFKDSRTEICIMAFDKNILEKRIKTDHVWWEDKKIPFYTDLSKRRYYEGFYSLIKQKSLHRAVALMGPRRVGKTVMMYQAIQDLLDEGVDPNKILYFSLDTPIYTNISLEELIQKAFEPNDIGMENSYIFFDEIQYFKDWEIHLKALVDRNRTTKFIASGSAAAALKMKSVESEAGRFSDFFYHH
jgi:predicted AAA+ superfamily ATPase